MENEEIDQERREFTKKAYKVPVLIALGSLIPPYVEGGSCVHPNPAGNCPPGQQPKGWR